MAKPSIKLIAAIRSAAHKILHGAQYQWGHMGSCNCGHLAQELSTMSKAEIHAYAMRKSGDWSEQVRDYCPTSGLLMDQLISLMLDAGLDRDDLKQLEKLSSPLVLQSIPLEKRHLSFNKKEDVAYYMNVWAALLEEELLHGIQVRDLPDPHIEFKKETLEEISG